VSEPSRLCLDHDPRQAAAATCDARRLKEKPQKSLVSWCIIGLHQGQESSAKTSMYMKSIQYIAAVAAIAAAASATAQVAFTSTLSAVGGSGVNGGFGGSYISPVAVGAAGGAIGGGGSVSATGTAVVIAPNPGPAVANVPVITSATLTGAGGFSALITPTLISSVQGNDGTVNVGTGAFPVYVDVRTDSYTLTLAPGTLLPVGTGTYSINLFNGATLVSQGTFNATVSVVPEPETYAAAAALGLVGFGLWRRRNA